MLFGGMWGAPPVYPSPPWSRGASEAALAALQRAGAQQNVIKKHRSMPAKIGRVTPKPGYIYDAKNKDVRRPKWSDFSWFERAILWLNDWTPQ